MSDLETQLEEFSKAVSVLQAHSKQPKTAFELLNTSRFEEAWQAYLGYFLDPTESHHLEGRFLLEFLKMLIDQEVISFSPPRVGLAEGNDIAVFLERQSDANNRPDIIITSGVEWFLCIELKVHASEGGGDISQTQRYAMDPKIVPGGTDSYEDGDFIYIKPKSAPTSTSNQFSDVNWISIKSVVGAVIEQDSGSIPTRTLAQLADFSALIDSQIGFGEIDDATRRRKDLYFEYLDVIRETQQSVKPFVEQVLQEGWADALETDFVPSNADQFDWRFRAIGKSYGQIRTPRWVQAKTQPEFLDIHWEHKPSEDDFKRGRLRFILELEEPGRSTIGSNSGERYHRFREDIVNDLSQTISLISDPRWSESIISPGRSKKKLARFTYEYAPGDETGYFESLKFALEDTGPITEFVTQTLDSLDYTQFPID